jgi:5-methylcytosine-specific restriction endonuclease McrA
MELKVQLIPKTAWGKNVRSNVKKSEWDKIRKTVYEKENMICRICGDKDTTLHAHEVWDFDEETHIQKLIDIVGICAACHNTIHYGRAQKMGTAKEAKEHFMKVNDADDLDWTLEIQEVQINHLRKSKIREWKLDISLIEKYGIKN